MKLSGESANLEFETGNITIPINTTRDLLISQQINLRVALGDMYNRYNKFYMVFNSIASFGGANMTYTSGSVAGVTNSTAWLIGVTGLDFVNNSVNGVISKTALFPTSVSLAQNNFSIGGQTQTMNGVVFNKPSNDIQNITISPYLVRGLQVGRIVATAQQIADYNFSFTVYGLED
jgi:hypothetical protein